MVFGIEIVYIGKFSLINQNKANKNFHQTKLYWLSVVSTSSNLSLEFLENQWKKCHHKEEKKEGSRPSIRLTKTVHHLLKGRLDTNQHPLLPWKQSSSQSWPMNGPVHKPTTIGRDRTVKNHLTLHPKDFILRTKDTTNPQTLTSECQPQAIQPPLTGPDSGGRDWMEKEKSPWDAQQRTSEPRRDSFTSYWLLCLLHEQAGQTLTNHIL